MKIQYMSDLHLEGWIPKFIKNMEVRGDVLVLAGDITSAKALPRLVEAFSRVEKPILYVPGNHEYYGGDTRCIEEDYAPYLKQHLPNMYILDGSEFVLNDTVFIGATLFSNVNPQEYEDVLRCIGDFKFVGGNTLARHLNQYDLAKGYILERIRHHNKNPAKKIVVVTHFPPSYQAQEERFKASGLGSYFYNSLEVELEDLNVDLWIYGHTHGNLNFNMGNIPVVTNQLGYYREPTSLTFDVNKTIEV